MFTRSFRGSAPMRGLRSKQTAQSSIVRPGWRVRYRYKGDHPWATSTHVSETPRELVRWMRDFFDGNPNIEVHKVWVIEPERAAA